MEATIGREAGFMTRANDPGYRDAAVETMPRERLEALQLERLRATVANAWSNVPLHRERMRARGVAPDDIRTLADVARLQIGRAHV